MSKRKKEHRQDKLYEKVKSEMGMRIQNRFWREQVKWSKLPIIVFNDAPVDFDVDAWLNYGKMNGQLLYNPPHK